MPLTATPALARDARTAAQPVAGPNGVGAVDPGPDPTTNVARRLQVRGKFLFDGNEKVYLRGVTYGPFRPEPDGSEYHDPKRVGHDFAQMASHGVNAVRTYTLPPRWLLDLAQQSRLRVLVGLPWEQHVAFLGSSRRAREIERRVRSGARACSGHPAVLGYAVGNEIPSPLVRWHGHRRIERYLERLYDAAKNADPSGLVTYVNYPSTEYLELPFLDFAAFNVYLESQPKLQAYLARLQNISGERPLLVGELGLDSLRNGPAVQAQMLEWQSRTAFAAGCAGLFVFAWTDEWHRGGQDIQDWKFGLTTRAGDPKPALAAVRQVFHEIPVERTAARPLISVVVCSYNGSRTLSRCLEHLGRQYHPPLEVIVVDDGSTDSTSALAVAHHARVIRIPNGGLSNARNVGWQAARGEVVAYLDDDAAPDEHWLTYLGARFAATDYAGIGGPNISFPEDGFVAQCVDHSPGNPTHVLLTDQEAEHLPGCNMAFRKSCLEAIGGFDTQFRIAGDDVDLCWRLQQRGWKLGFDPAAMVWHHRRGTIRTYWKQQLNYGKAEAMLERKWPEKYNAVGHTTWSGRLYNKGFLYLLNWNQRRIYHGTWGTALFQSVYNPSPGLVTSLLMLPEWYLVIAFFAVLSACGILYQPLRYALIALALAFLPPLIHAAQCGAAACFHLTPPSRWRRLRLASLTAVLHFLQPVARLWGRLCYGLTPWRRRGASRWRWPWPRAVDLWSESNWQAAEDRLRQFENTLQQMGAAVARGGDFDRWDLEVRGGLLGRARLLLAVEEHGSGRQYVRMRLRPVVPVTLLVLASLFALVAMVAAAGLRWDAWALLNLPALVLLWRSLYESGSAMGAIVDAVSRERTQA
jgi:GT2 family glycosyltransferase